MSEQDVDRFLWDLERAMSHVDGDRRLELTRQAERLLHDEAAGLAEGEGSEDVTWYHYVQATANLGPAERLAAELTGEPLPDLERDHRRLWIAVGLLALFTVLIVGYTVFTHGELERVGQWSGSEETFSGARAFTFNVSEQADSVFLSLNVAPSNGAGVASVTVLDGASNTVLEGTATLQDHLQVTRYVDGAPGTWRLFIDFREFTGGWRVDARQELP